MISQRRAVPGDRAPGRIAVFRALRLGDVLCSVPALRALRRLYPRSHIDLIGLPWAGELPRRYPELLDGFLAFPGFSGLPEQDVRPRDTASFFGEVRRRRYDLAIQLHGSGRITNRIVRKFGAARTAGFFPPHEVCPDPETFLPFDFAAHEVTRQLDLVRYLGAPRASERPRFPVTAADREALRQVPELKRLPPGRYVCLHPGARDKERRWSPEKFAVVGRRLMRHGWTPVLTGSRWEERTIHDVQKRLPRPAIDAARADLPLGPLAALLGGSKAVLCNDTGASHLAGAVGAPSVVVFTATEPERWLPKGGHPIAVQAGPGDVDRAWRALRSHLTSHHKKTGRPYGGQPENLR